jgi:broad specificity phosphatase PhoE
MSTRLHFVRHAVTASNRERRYMGRSEEPLAADGRLQARRLARRLAEANLEALYCSPLRRAAETADIIGQPHALEPRPAPEFIEFDLSRWQGLTAAEIEARDAHAWETWCADPASLRVPGIESFAALRQRVRRGLEKLAKAHADADVVVVTHDGIIRISVLEALGLSFDAYRAIPVDNAALTTLEVARERTYLRSLNDTGHLEGLAQHLPGPADR